MKKMEMIDCSEVVHGGCITDNDHIWLVVENRKPRREHDEAVLGVVAIVVSLPTTAIVA
jgi:hypothetical protein